MIQTPTYLSSVHRNANEFGENLKIAESCVETGRRLIQFSSCEVHGKTAAAVFPGAVKNPEDPLFAVFSEDTSGFFLGPVQSQRWMYACAKQLLERVLHAYGLEKKLSAALRNLEAAAQKAPGTLEGVVGALDRALMEAGEARASLEQAMHDHVFDQQRLEEIEERLFALRALARKHKVSVDQLLPLRDEFATQLQSIETGQADVSESPHQGIRLY